jgi:hypothetical protein
LEYGQFRPRGDPSYQSLSPLPSGSYHCRLYNGRRYTCRSRFSLQPGQPPIQQIYRLEVIQDRPSTPEAWATWRKACSLWSTSLSAHGSFQASPFADLGLIIGTLQLEDSEFVYQTLIPPTAHFQEVGEDSNFTAIPTISPPFFLILASPLPPWSFVSESPVFPVKSSYNLLRQSPAHHLNISSPSNQPGSINYFTLFTTSTLLRKYLIFSADHQVLLLQSAMDQ